jgi:pyrimidine operon attenuation protein/uracil phosphoribosyltransferase
MNTILNKHQLQITIERLACQVIENYVDLSTVVLIGLQPRGIFLADKIYTQLKKINPEQNFLYGKLDITFYRDDIRKELREPNQTDITFSLEDKNVILIDDVLYTG